MLSAVASNPILRANLWHRSQPCLTSITSPCAPCLEQREGVRPFLPNSIRLDRKRKDHATRNLEMPYAAETIKNSRIESLGSMKEG